MLDVAWLVAIVVVAILLTAWATFTVTRLDRLHARVDAAYAALDAQLVRRSAALTRLAETGPDALGPVASRRLAGIAHDARTPDQDARTRMRHENAVGRAVVEVTADPRADLDPAALVELHEAATRVLLARRFYNDAVRDTRTLRARRLPRLLHMAGHRALPDFFDIDDTPPARPAAVPPATPVPTHTPTTEEDRP